MYQRSDLGFTLPRWLTPPSWVRSIAGAAIRGTIITIPTPAGPQSFDLGDPAAMAQLKALVSGAKVSVTRQPPSGGPGQFVQERVPGGWLTIGAAVVGVILLMTFMRPGARRA